MDTFSKLARFFFRTLFQKETQSNSLGEQTSVWKDESDGCDSSDIKDLSLVQMGITLGLVAVVSAASAWMKLELAQSFGIACLRTVVQLALLGVILVPIIAADKVYVVLPYLAFMMLIAAQEATAKMRYYYRGVFLHVYASFLVGAVTVGACAWLLVVRPDPWYSAQYVIPMSGMMLGNATSAVAVGLGQFLTEMHEGRDRVEHYLARGATAWEAARPAFRAALRAGVTPTLNQMSVIGLVSIPGMMTGQLLGGNDPGAAAKYQMMIMFLICANSFVVAAAAFLLATRTIFHGAHHQLRADRVLRREGKKQDLLVRNAAALWGWARAAPGAARRLAAALLCCGCCRGRAARTGKGGGPLDLGAFEDAAGAPFLGEEGEPGGGGGGAAATLRAQFTPAPARAAGGGGGGAAPALSAAGLACAVPAGGGGGGGGGQRALYEGVGFQVARGQVLAVTGPSGCGKSRLLRSLALLDPLQAGEVVAGGRARLAGPGEEGGGGSALADGARDVPGWRRAVAYVGQSRVTLPGTPGELLEELCRLGVGRRERRQPAAAGAGAGQAAAAAAARARAAALLGELGVEGGGRALARPWHELSGGEAQRAQLALALALRPPVLLLDEPTSACDPATALRVEAAVAAAGAAVVWVTHDAAQARRVGDGRLEFVPAPGGGGGGGAEV